MNQSHPYCNIFRCQYQCGGGQCLLNYVQVVLCANVVINTEIIELYLKWKASATQDCRHLRSQRNWRVAWANLWVHVGEDWNSQSKWDSGVRTTFESRRQINNFRILICKSNNPLIVQPPPTLAKYVLKPRFKTINLSQLKWTHSENYQEHSVKT